jgi:ankyrin repeat protein
LKAQNDEEKGVKLLLAQSGIQDLPDSEGRTALMWAAGKGMLKYLW